ncbi:MAG: flagellin [Thermoguttaceae bacterium]
MTGIYVASNVPAMNAQFQMQKNIGSLSSTMNRLSTGLRINSAKDDPAGLIASELLKSDITATNMAIRNTQRANGMIGVATSALGQVTSLLNDVRGLVVESANEGAMNDAQIAANQLQIDASLDSIDRIARTTNYLGKKLIDGSLDYQTSGTTGPNTQVSDLNITSANLGLASSLDVNVKVNKIAEKAQLFMNGTGVSEKTVVQIGGSKGTEAFNFGAGTTTSDMAKAIAAVSDATGVTAYVEGKASRGSLTLSSAGMNNDIVLTSKEVGKNAGNYTFRIVHNESGNPDSAKVLTSPSGDKAGVVEIALKAAQTATSKGVAGGLFNATLYGASGTTQSIYMQMGEKAGVELNTVASPLVADQSGITSAVATGNSTRTAIGAITAGGADVAFLMNGWTVQGTTDTTIIAAANLTGHQTDFENKIIYVNGTTGAGGPDLANQSTAMRNGIAEVVAAAGVEGTVDASACSITGNATTAGLGLQNGDKFKLEGARPVNMLTVTYTSGMTAQAVADMVNKSGQAQMSLTNVNNADTVMGIAQNGKLSSGVVSASSFETNYTAEALTRLLSSDLGSLFDVELATNDVVGNSGGGRVSFMNASVTYGDVNAGNAIRFTGTHESPAIRMVNEGKANQKLSITISDPEDADKKNGITGQILKINLATDAQGNSTTTAKQVVDLFNSLTSQQTLGVSASLVLPDGVDPNGRVWGETICGTPTLDTSCTYVAGEGIVKATGWKEACDLVEFDMVFAAQNQGFVYDNPYANITAKAPHAGPVTAMTATGVGALAIDFMAMFTDATNTDPVTAQAIRDEVATWKIGTDAANANSTATWNATTKTLTLGVTTASTAALTAQAVQNVLRGVNGVAANGMTVTFTGTNDFNYAGATATAAGITALGTVLGGTATVAAAPLTLTVTNSNAIGTNFVTTPTGSTTRTSGGFIVSTAAGGDAVSAGLAISTTTATNALNDITINFTSDASKAGFSTDSKTLMVYVDKDTADKAVAHKLTTDGTVFNVTTELDNVEALVNAAIKDNWQEIATVNRATEKAGDVKINLAATALSGANFTASFEFSRILESGTGGAVKVGSGSVAIVGATIGATGGVKSNTANGPAVVIEATTKGTDFSNVAIKFFFDKDAIENTAIFDPKAGSNGVLTITHNKGSMTAGELVKIINNSASKSLFTAKIASGGSNTIGDATVLDLGQKAATVGGWYQGNTTIGDNDPNGVRMTGGTDANERLVLESTEMGSAQTVRVNVIAGKFNTTDKLNADAKVASGKDMVATINGNATKAVGNRITLNSPLLQMSLTVDNSTIFNNKQSTKFTIDGGGAIFQTGPQVVTTQQTATGIQSMSTVNLGGISGKLYQLRTGEAADMKTNTKLADKIVNEAISNVTSISGRLGALQRSTLDPAIASLQNNLVALSDVEASISNADFAEETSKMARQQILVQTGARALAQLNQLPQYAQMLMG